MESQDSRRPFLILEPFVCPGSWLEYLAQQKAQALQSTDSRPYVLHSVLAWMGCITCSPAPAGSGLPLQEADQEE